MGKRALCIYELHRLVAIWHVVFTSAVLSWGRKEIDGMKITQRHGDVMAVTSSRFSHPIQSLTETMNTIQADNLPRRNDINK